APTAAHRRRNAARRRSTARCRGPLLACPRLWCGSAAGRRAPRPRANRRIPPPGQGDAPYSAPMAYDEETGTIRDVFVVERPAGTSLSDSSSPGGISALLRDAANVLAGHA